MMLSAVSRASRPCGAVMANPVEVGTSPGCSAQTAKLYLSCSALCPKTWPTTDRSNATTSGIASATTRWTLMAVVIPGRVPPNGALSTNGPPCLHLRPSASHVPLRRPERAASMTGPMLVSASASAKRPYTVPEVYWPATQGSRHNAAAALPAAVDPDRKCRRASIPQPSTLRNWMTSAVHAQLR